MSAQVEILTGLPGSGKTARLLADYRTALGSSPREVSPGSTLWLTPTERSRQLVLSQLLHEELPVCLAPNVLTFDGFAERVLAESQRYVASLGESAKRTLLRNIIADLKRDKQLPYFYSIAESSGFLNLVISFIAELKKEENWPELFLNACEKQEIRIPRKDAELGLIYQKYQDYLNEQNRYDNEGRFWAAKTVLDSNYRGSFSKLSLVVVDGFSDFTFTQHQILSHLGHWSQRLVISLPLEYPVKRQALLEKPAAQVEKFDYFNYIGCDLTSDHLPSLRLSTLKDRRQQSFQQIARQLFAPARSFQRLPHAEGVQILAATGAIGEVQILGERIKQLLQSGISPEDIVVVFRSITEDYNDLLHEIWTASGIPFWSEKGQPLARMPLLRFVFSLVQLEQEDWPFDRLLSVLHSNYFHPVWESWQNGNAVRAMSRILRQRKVQSGRNNIWETLKHAGNSQPEDLELALKFFHDFSDLLKPFRQKQPFEVWITAILELLRQLQPVPSVEEPNLEELDAAERRLLERDWRTLEHFEQLLEDALEAEQFRPEAAPEHTIHDLQQRLADLFRHAELPPSDNEQGCVRVLSASSVRNLDIDYLFLAGLSETSFPSPAGTDSFYNDYERRGLNVFGLSLGHRASHNQDEMLLFFRVVTRARQQLTLSYPSVSTAGDTLFPSPYLTALRDLFEPDALQPQYLGALDPIPEKDRVLTAADFRVVAVHEALQGDGTWLRAHFDYDESRAAATNLLAALEMNAARFEQRGFSRFEGRLRLGKHRQQIQEKFHPKYEYSVSQLEAYAVCPFRFLLTDLLKIEPLESPEISTNYIHRGVTVHRILSFLHRQAGQDGITLTGELITQQFQDRLNVEYRPPESDSKLLKTLSSIEQEVLLEWAAAYGEQWDEYRTTFETLWDGAPRPSLLEVGFGDVPEDEETHAELYAGIPFGPPDQPVQIQGKIDRIDVGTVKGEPVYNIVDYKTGTVHRFNQEDFESGRALQLPVYLLTVQRLGLAGEHAKPFQMGFWGLKETGFVTGLKDNKRKMAGLEEAVLDGLKNHLDQLLPRLVRQLQNAEFPVFNADEECSSGCPYKTCCRVNQIRPLQESLGKYPGSET